MNSSELKTVFCSPPGTCAQPGSCVPIIRADILGLCRFGLFLTFLGHAWQLIHRAEESTRNFAMIFPGILYTCSHMRIAGMPACHVMGVYICQRENSLGASNAAAQESRQTTNETACAQRLELTILSHRRIIISLAHVTTANCT